MTPVAIKRFDEQETLRRGSKRYQRRFATRTEAVEAAKRYLAEPHVKAVWAFDGDTELFHATREENDGS